MDNHTRLDLKSIPDELTLILEIIKLEGHEHLNLIDFTKYRDIDWDLFLKLAIHHRVYPLIYPIISKLNSQQLPEYIVRKLLNLYKRNTYQMLYLCSEMELINNICLENQIRVLFLKGPILANELYGDLSHRTSVDLDILVSLSDLEKMEKLVIRSGYVKDDYIETVLNDWKWRHHHITFYHPEKGVKLEVHWRLNPGPGVEPTFNELWERRKPSSLTTKPVFLLGNEDLFLFLVTHGCRHGWSRLRWLIDIHRLISRGIDWKKNNDLLKKYHYHDLGGQALFLSSELLNTQITEEMKPLLKGDKPRRLAREAIFYLERMVNLHTDPLPEDVANYHKRHLFSLMSSYQKLFFLMSFLFPFPEDAKTLPLPKVLHFLYFPLRPILWAWRKTKSQALQ